MTARTPHLRSLLLASVLAVATVGCGVEASSDGASAPTAATTDDGSSSSSSAESSTEATPDTAPATEPEDTTDDTATDDTVATDEPDDGGDISVPEGIDDDTFKESLAMGFESAGLTEEQASCVADGYVEKFGTDTSTASDYTAMLDLFTACDVDLMDLGG